MFNLNLSFLFPGSPFLLHLNYYYLWLISDLSDKICRIYVWSWNKAEGSLIRVEGGERGASRSTGKYSSLFPSVRGLKEEYMW